MEGGRELEYGGYRIRLKSERVRATDKNLAGWKPTAEVLLDSGDSLTVQPLELTKDQIVPTKEEADTIALQTARSWIEKRAFFGEHVTEAARILKEWVKRD